MNGVLLVGLWFIAAVPVAILWYLLDRHRAKKDV